MTLHLHRAPRTDLLADELGDLGAPWRTRSRPSWCWCRPAASSGGSASGSRTGSAGATRSTASAPGWTSARRVARRRAHRHGPDDPWTPDALAWPLLEVIDESLDEPWNDTLARHLGHFDTGDEAEFRRGRRYAVARRIAALFASYAVQRPQLLVDWLDGRPTGHGGRLETTWPGSRGSGRRSWLGSSSAAARPTRRGGRPAARRGARPACAALALRPHADARHRDRAARCAGRRPRRARLAAAPDVMWRALQGEGGPVARREDRSHRRVDHPLLATLGRDVRELQRSLTSTRAVDHHHGGPPLPDTASGGSSPTLRPRVRPQARARTAGPVGPGALLPRCGTTGRRAARGAAGPAPGRPDARAARHPRHVSRHRDLRTAHHRGIRPRRRPRGVTPPTGSGSGWPTGRSPRPTRCWGRGPLLDLAGSRATAAACSTSRRRRRCAGSFDFDDDDLATVTAWARESGVRWGFDKEHRAPFGLEQFLQNTGSSGWTGCSREWCSPRTRRPARHHAAARRRRQQPGRARRAARRVRGAADGGDRRPDRHPAARRLAGGAGRRGRQPDPGGPRRRVAVRPGAARVRHRPRRRVRP